MKKTVYISILLLLVFSCKSPEARYPVSEKSGSFIRESVQRNKKIVAREEEKIQDIIEKDGNKREYFSSPNGFWYYYVKQDTTAQKKPIFGDVVKFDYTLETLEGEPIYSKQELTTQTYAIDKEVLFPGLREGLKLMHPGEKITFLFPSHKAFGYYGDKKKIGRNVPVKSTVTLYAIKNEKSDKNNSNQTKNQ